MLTNEKAVEIRRNIVFVEDAQTKERGGMPCDATVLALGTKPNDTLYNDLVR